MTVGAVLLACRLGLAAVFAVAALGKLGDREGSRTALVGFGVAERLARPLAILLPLAELAIAVALLPAGSAWWGALAALGLLLAFIAGVSVTLARGRTPDCHCFGQIHSAPVGPGTLARNGVLAAAAAVVVIGGRDSAGPSAAAWVRNLDALEAVVLALALATFFALVVVGSFVATLLRQYGRLLLRLEALESRIASGTARVEPSREFGLPPGSPAPSFALPDLSGRSVSLDELLGRRNSVLLFFSSPTCGPCEEVFPVVRAAQQTYSDRLTAAVITRGDAADNAHVGDGMRDVLLQDDNEIASAYEVPGTPGAVLIEPGGTIASGVALGANPIHELITRAVAAPGDDTPSVAGNGGGPDGATFEPRPTPAFRLPDLTGAWFELSDLRGSETLLLFWDPDSEHCRLILDSVKAWERDNPAGLRKLVLISRGSIEANRALGLYSLILLDDSGEVARAFGVLGAPAAVVLDERTDIASHVRFGASAVLGLGGFRMPLGTGAQS